MREINKKNKKVLIKFFSIQKPRLFKFSQGCAKIESAKKKRKRIVYESLFDFKFKNSICFGKSVWNGIYFKN